MIMRIYEWLWSFLPDKCSRRRIDCQRRGIRGNENIVEDGTVLCDMCHTTYVAGQRYEKMMRDFRSRRYS